MKCSDEHPKVKLGGLGTERGLFDRLLKPTSNIVAKAKVFPEGIKNSLGNG